MYSIIAEGPNERYTYIKAGTSKENQSRIIPMRCLPASTEVLGTNMEQRKQLKMQEDGKLSLLRMVNMAGVEGNKKIEPGIFTGRVPAGKYDMEAQLIDKEGLVYPAYTIHIEKL